MGEVVRPAAPSLASIRANLPKIELHAHLSGSVSQEFLAEREEGFKPVDVVGERSLARCFEYFTAVGHVITNLDGLRAAADHVFEAVAAERCMYMEMRTTPKRLGGASLEDYVRTVEEAAAVVGDAMEVKLLLSLDRGKVDSLAAAESRVEEILALAAAFPDFVVGVDICGDPRTKSVVPHVLPALCGRKAAFEGLPITFHTAEIQDDPESLAIIDAMYAGLNIRRLGHACYLPEECRRRLLETGDGRGRKVGIELCPTSNLVAMNEIPDLTHHHFPLWWPHGGEVSITVNTDDAGLFNCSLSSELRDIAEAFDLTWGDLVELEEHAIDASFHPEPERLRAAFRRQLAAQAAAPAPGLTPEPAPLPPKAAATVAAAQDASA